MNWNPFRFIGDFGIFLYRSIFIPWRLSSTWQLILDQVYDIGFGTLPLILVISVFTGLVSTVQTVYQIVGPMPKYILGYTVGRMVLIELGPVLTALMVSGRCASSMAAEIGTMRVTEQIDALEVMAIDPYRFLSLPRIIGTFIALPMLAIISEAVALVVSASYAHYFLETPFSLYNYGLVHFFYARDLFGGLIKTVVFSFVIATSGCYYGFKVQGGAREVGQAATKAVVTASIMILVLDFLVALVVFG